MLYLVQQGKFWAGGHPCTQSPAQSIHQLHIICYRVECVRQLIKYFQAKRLYSLNSGNC